MSQNLSGHLRAGWLAAQIVSVLPYCLGAVDWSEGNLCRPSLRPSLQVWVYFDHLRVVIILEQAGVCHDGASIVLDADD